MSQSKRRQEAPEGGGRGRVVALGVVVCAALALGILSWKGDGGDRTQTPPPTQPPKSTSPPPRTAPEPPTKARSVGPGTAPVAFRPLLDEWVRPDGGYVLSVTGIAEDGTATVGYFNPNPINVGRAKARIEGEVMGLFVEMQDKNYPGSTYTLAYDAKEDRLVGVYFQAVQGASYDVVFVRRR
jgi:hypothetical protein